MSQSSRPILLLLATVLAGCTDGNRVVEPVWVDTEYFFSFEAALRYPATARMVMIYVDPVEYPNHVCNIPEGVATLVNLESISIHGCRIGPIPRSMCLCRKLEALIFENNKLEMFPSDVFCLNSSLRALALPNNDVQILPASIDSLRKLQLLWLDHNSLDSIPDEVGNIKFLIRLTLRGNNLQTVPSTLSKLKNLKVLWLDSNRISSLPEELGQLTLDTLTLSGNPLSEQEKQRIRAFMPAKTNIYF